MPSNTALDPHGAAVRQWLLPQPERLNRHTQAIVWDSHLDAPWNPKKTRSFVELNHKSIVTVDHLTCTSSSSPTCCTQIQTDRNP